MEEAESFTAHLTTRPRDCHCKEVTLVFQNLDMTSVLVSCHKNKLKNGLKYLNEFSCLSSHIKFGLSRLRIKMLGKRLACPLLHQGFLGRDTLLIPGKDV